MTLLNIVAVLGHEHSRLDIDEKVGGPRALRDSRGVRLVGDGGGDGGGHVANGGDGRVAAAELEVLVGRHLRERLRRAQEHLVGHLRSLAHQSAEPDAGEDVNVVSLRGMAVSCTDDA